MNKTGVAVLMGGVFLASLLSVPANADQTIGPSGLVSVSGNAGDLSGLVNMGDMIT